MRYRVREIPRCQWVDVRDGAKCTKPGTHYYELGTWNGGVLRTLNWCDEHERTYRAASELLAAD